MDLGVDSPRLGEGAWESADGLAAAVAVGGPGDPGAPGEIAVGRWGEVRLPHAGVPGEVAPATLHLGADLFVPAGTEVSAPLAGEVVRAADREVTVAPDRAASDKDGTTPGPPLFLRLAGIESTLAPGDRVERGATVGHVAGVDHSDVRNVPMAGISHTAGAAAPLPPHLHVQLALAPDLPGLGDPRHRDAWLALCPDPSPLLGAGIDAAAPPPPDPAAERARREAVIAGAQGLYYREPLEIVRGWRATLFDSHARPYVDVVNNVAAVGHSHPGVTAAATEQLRLLNTNSRFLYDSLTEYAERVAALLPPDVVGGAFAPSLDWRVGAFALGAALVTGLAAGAFPALHGTRPDLITAVRAGAGQIAGAPRAAARVRSALVGAQIALSMLLLATAGLALRSLVNVTRVELGMRVDRVVTFGVAPGRNGYGGARSQALFARLKEELAALPGVTGVAASENAVLSGSEWGNDVAVEGSRLTADADRNARLDRVSAGYFRLFDVPLLAGREFTEADRPGAPRVALVNEAFVRRFGLGRDVVGRRMVEGDAGPYDIAIVGVVRDAKYASVKTPVPPLYFTAAAQDTGASRLQFYVRTAGDPGAALRAAAAVVARLDPALPVERPTTLPAQVREGEYGDRAVGVLAGAFAALATLLAAIGLYGVLAYAVTQRAREIGVRVALGASARAVRGLVFGRVGRLVAAGGVAGLAAALVVGRLAQALLFGVGGNDPAALGAAAAVLAAVGLAAGYVPARRAARVDPVEALRAE